MARIYSAIIFLPILFAAIWLLPPLYFCVLVGIAVALGLLEYFALTEKSSSQTGRLTAIPAATGILAAFYYQRFDLVVAALAALVFMEMTARLFENRDLQSAITTSATTIFGVMYVALLGGYLIAVRTIMTKEIPKMPPLLLNLVETPPGGFMAQRQYAYSSLLVTLFFLVIFAGDTGAYYVGRAFGRHKLAPRISPGKTIEGLAGGLLANALAVVISKYTFFPDLELSLGIPLALAMGVLGVIGDLCESMLKRGAGAKDAGQIIPGHGGILDRLDSLLFNAPLLYYFHVLFLK